MSKARGIGIVNSVIALCIVMMVLMASMMPPLPERVVVWWDEGHCWWFNGTIEDKWIEEGDGNALTKDYKFLVNGTLDNTTDIVVVVHGSAWDYEFFNVGMHYEGLACDTVPLREAVIDGTVHFLLWATDS